MPFDGPKDSVTQSVNPDPTGFFARLRGIFAHNKTEAFTTPVSTMPVAKTLPVSPLFASETLPGSVGQVLLSAQGLIADRKDWVQRRYETRDGRRCAVGALRAVGRMDIAPETMSRASSALRAIAISRGFNDIESMNDNSSHRQVLSAFGEAANFSRFAYQ